ncbi:hypothetical protein UFOVP623_25 [uncultured Caudovirales phage]|uniref:Uncharacterized protein n=1 Tax=uncultured Caudovirales phage TaxID=2100421 RepID=A0A6J5N4W1_9CAUD|nr:hypothetical protein UFOVP623_25 [uncultured Caudovirales phage]
MIDIPQVDGVPYVNNAEFVKLTIVNSNTTTTVHTFSSSYKNEVIDGTTYLALGGLLNIGSQQRDLRVTSSDTTITLSGLMSENMYLVLGTQIKGSLIEIWRGFYDDNYILVNTVRRYNGIITSYTITEDIQENIDNFVISVNCSAYKLALENRIAGRKTNSNSWKTFNPTDVSMDKVPALDNAYFDFGKPAGSKGNKVATATVTPG